MYKKALRLVNEIYEAADNPKHWEVALRALCEILSSMSAVILIHNKRTNRFQGTFGYNFPKIALFAYNHGLGHFDPGFKVMANTEPGEVKVILSPHKTNAFPAIFKKVLEPSGIAGAIGMTIFNDEEWHVGLGIHHNKHHNGFTPEHMDFLVELNPHFQRAIRFQREFQRLRDYNARLQGSLENITLGILHLTSRVEILYSNPVAEALLEQHPAIARRGKFFLVKKDDDNKRLQHHLVELVQPGINKKATVSLALRHPDSAHPLNVLLAPEQATDEASVFSESTVLAYLSDPSATTHASPELLALNYGLSKKEAIVAITLANGLSIEQIATHHHVSSHTVRSQLKTIFNKTGVSRQADLVRLVLSNQGLPRI